MPSNKATYDLARLTESKVKYQSQDTSNLVPGKLYKMSYGGCDGASPYSIYKEPREGWDTICEGIEEGAVVLYLSSLPSVSNGLVWHKVIWKDVIGWTSCYLISGDTPNET